ncbi:hypothetical protein [Streptomyces sp. NPDC000851]
METSHARLLRQVDKAWLLDGTAHSKRFPTLAVSGSWATGCLSAGTSIDAIDLLA